MNNLMTHIVAGYPSYKDSLALLKEMDKAGARHIEVQIPFSDPIADGEVIMRANDRALESGMTTEKSFELIKEASANIKSGIFIMSYLQKLLHCGYKNFCQKAKKAGATGLIIPDLPLDSADFKELYKFASENNLIIVPVISPGISKKRLKSVLKLKPRLVYLTSKKGITGANLSISSELSLLTRSIKTDLPECVVAVGFGVKTKNDVRQILKFADMAVVGSEIIREIDRGGIISAGKKLRSLI